MLNITRISKNLLLVSLASSLLVFWLGSRYLSDAHTQLSGARQLQRSVEPETTLFELAHNLNREQAVIQRILISTTQHDQEIQKLDSLNIKTRSLFDRAQEEITSSRADSSAKDQFRYSDESIENLLLEIEDKFKRKSLLDTIISYETVQPLAQRDEFIRMKIFDSYAHLIDAINDLRRRTHSLPNKNYRGVLADHDTKDSIWSICHSINQAATLVESYLLKGELSALTSLNRENLSLRILQLDADARQSLAMLTDMVQGKIITDDTATSVIALHQNYQHTFGARLKKLIPSITAKRPPGITTADWNPVASTTSNKALALADKALASTLTRADTIKRSATISLFINGLLVLLCVAMVYVSFRVAKKIQHQADHDHLTNISNRRKFYEVLENKLYKTDISNQECLILMTIDLNGFKTINDSMGHAVGDKLLVGVAQRLQSVVSEDMELARMGGDEFAICYTARNTDSPMRFAWRVRDSFEKLFPIDGSLMKLGVSIGYSIYPDDAKTIEKLQITSDFAMFSAKQSGTKSIQPYDSDIADQFEKRIAMEKDLLSAITNNELELHYQPQFNLDLNQIDAAEALIRWNHPTRGMVSPFEFISVAEECGLMPAIGEWVMTEAFRQTAEWNNIKNFRIRVAVNVSVHQMTQPDFVQKVLHTMERYNISAEFLELEVTESVLISDIDWIVESLSQLKSHGLRIALDDFGTGYSSLSQLQTLPLDTLKIDRSFISKLDDDSPSVKSVTATIKSIAQAYELETVAEGIETAGQLREVNKLGINVAQGYYFSKPLPKDELVEAVIAINEDAATGMDRNAA